MSNLLADGPDDPVVWGWAESADSETWEGFPSRQEAEAYGRTQEGGPGFVVEGRYYSPSAAAVAALDLDDMLERMEERVCDLHSPADEVFEPENAHEAEVALEAALAEWAANHIDVKRWTTVGKPIAVEVLT